LRLSRIGACRSTAVAFVYNDPARAETHTLSLHDALPIFVSGDGADFGRDVRPCNATSEVAFRHKIGLVDTAASDAGIVTSLPGRDRKSTRLNSSHRTISYAVFCLKKKTSGFESWPNDCTT